MAVETREITDAGGRKLTVRDLDILTQARMLRAIGPAQSGNQPYVQMVMAACMVTAIDGIPVPFPRDEKTIDAAMVRLGDDGMAAAMVDMIRSVNETMAAAEAAVEGEGTPPNPLPRSGS